MAPLLHCAFGGKHYFYGIDASEHRRLWAYGERNGVGKWVVHLVRSNGESPSISDDPSFDALGELKAFVCDYYDAEIE